MALKRLHALCYLGAMGRWLVALLFCLAFATAAHSQPGRLLPANGKIGDLAGGQLAFPLVRIGSEVLRLTPGALIFDESNRTIVHGALPEQATVLYVQVPGGAVSRLYLLRPDELQRLTRAAPR